MKYNAKTDSQPTKTKTIADKACVVNLRIEKANNLIINVFTAVT